MKWMRFVSQTTTQLSACTVTPKLMSNEMKINQIQTSKKKKIKLVQVSVGLKIHYTLTPTHMGTKHKLKINKLKLIKLFMYVL